MLHLAASHLRFDRRRLSGRQSIASVMSSVLWQHDATLQASYDGTSQYLRDLITGAAYDFTLGGSASVSTDDPTFNGAAGSPSAYFSGDGGDRFTLPTNTATVEAFHKTVSGQPFWGVIALNWASVAGSTTIWGDTLSSTLTGIRLTSNSTNRLQFTQRGDTAQVASNSSAWPTLANATDYLMIYSTDGTTLRSWVNNRTKVEESFTFNPSVLAANTNFRVFNGLPNGAKYYGDTFGLGFIDNSDAAKIFDYYNALHPRVYA